MNIKKESWLMLKLLLTMNIVLIAAIMFIHSGAKETVVKQSCNSEKRLNVDVLNSIAVRLM